MSVPHIAKDSCERSPTQAYNIRRIFLCPIFVSVLVIQCMLLKNQCIDETYPLVGHKQCKGRFTTSRLENSSLAVLSREGKWESWGVCVMPNFNHRSQCLTSIWKCTWHAPACVYNMQLPVFCNVYTFLWKCQYAKLKEVFTTPRGSFRYLGSVHGYLPLLSLTTYCSVFFTTYLAHKYLLNDWRFNLSEEIAFGLMYFNFIFPRYAVLFRIRTSPWLKIIALVLKLCFIWRALKS